jgi:predicted nucleotidyltransferase
MAIKLPPPPKPTLAGVKRALLTIPDRYLNQVEGLAVFGSLARGYDFNEYSDIDIVIVVKKSKTIYGMDTDPVWYGRLTKALAHYRRGVTVLVYTVEMVKEIPCWEALRMCTDAKVLIDNHGVKKLFKSVVKAAEDAGLRQQWTGHRWMWYKPRMKLGEIIEFRVK